MHLKAEGQLSSCFRSFRNLPKAPLVWTRSQQVRLTLESAPTTSRQARASPPSF